MCNCLTHTILSGISVTRSIRWIRLKRLRFPEIKVTMCLITEAAPIIVRPENTETEEGCEFEKDGSSGGDLIFSDLHSCVIQSRYSLDISD